MRGLPQTLPPALYEAASRRGGPARTFTGSRPTSTSEVPPVPAIPRQFTGSPVRTQSPLARQQFGTPLSAQSTGGDWLISPHDKADFDRIFNTVDTARRGVINGEQAVQFFSNSKLPEDVLAQIWDLADINSEGQLNKEEFAVAMFLIRQQRGKRDSRGVLPSTLPPNLIPPSMRRQNIPPSQPTAPVFDNAANINQRQPKSAADDLFGLDALSSPAQILQSTGDSSTAFRPPTASTSPPPPSTTFKPFIPSSTFGQSLAPNFTGGSSRAAPQASDDLLGDNDPEESRKLTPDTTELANLSNQVGTLSKQMQEVQTKRSSNEQEMSQTAQQKRDFEVRLSQLRGLYEQEVKDVKALDERLATVKNDVKKLQQEIAMVEGSYQDLKTHHKQSAAALEAEEKEKANLKERIRLRNADIAQLKPMVEKLKSDLRQQKGLVAINKKQLATNDMEHEKLKGEQESVSKEIEEQTRALSEPSVTSPKGMVSPAASTTSQSTNPFFRRATSTEQVASPPMPSRSLSAADHQNAFDSVFGPSFAAPSSSTPPPTSFRSSTPTQAREIPSAPAQFSEGARIPTPTMSPPPSTFNDSPRVVEPPPPPQSRQITSSHLPLQDHLERSDSFSSSVKVSAPASRFGGMDHSRADTPVESTGGARSEDGEPIKTEEKKEPNETKAQGANASYFGQEEVVSPAPTAPAEGKKFADVFGRPSASPDIPGAFPDDATPRSEVPPSLSAVAAGKQPENLHTGLADPFSAPRDQSRSPVAIKDDFDSAFDDLKPAKPSPTESGFPTTNGAGAASRKEFPDITELGGADESSDSESEKGFDDNFTSPPRRQERSIMHDGATDIEPASSLQPPRPVLPSNTSNTSTLPGADAQMSPPTYNESFPHEEQSSFPPEFKGLLPSREDPTSPPAGAPHSVPESSAALTTLTAPPPIEVAPTTSKELPKPQNDVDAGFDDFDENAFGGLAAAKESDEGEDFGTLYHGADEFDPAFDSPVTSKSPPVGSTNNSFFPQSNSTANNFHDFESNLGHPTQASPTTAKSSEPAANTTSDWDAIFAGLDNNSASASGIADGFPAPPSISTASQAKDEISPLPASALGPPPTVPKRPQPGRAISMGTEHDDPILKRLTGMGYPRDESLAALEKFDYNIDKVSYLTHRHFKDSTANDEQAADYLTSKS
jgi:epidermal growth factor receptor substrate 15